jgi:hypothetical protein
MMRSWRWRAAAILAPAGMMAAMFTGATAATASTSPTWQLLDEFTGTPVCNLTTGASDALQVVLSGTWSSPITVGASNLPAGGSYHFYGLKLNGYRLTAATNPIPPGSAPGNGVIIFGPRVTEHAYVVVNLPPGLALGSTVTITMFATDGTTTETIPVPILIQNSCTQFGS